MLIGQGAAMMTAKSMADKCFVHREAEATAVCHYCGKSYCDACMVLHGRSRILVCQNCFDAFAQKIKRSIKRRIIYAISGGISAVLILLYTIYSLLMGLGNSLTYLLIGGAVMTLTIFNIVRIGQSIEFLISETYQ